MIKILIRISIALGIVALLQALGAGIDSLIDWNQLTTMFSVIRRLWEASDSWWNMTLMVSLIGTTILLDIAEWLFMAGMIPFDWFHKGAD